MTVKTAAVLKSWRSSLYSFEWIDEEGCLKAPPEMPEREQEKRQAVETAVDNGEALEKPVLGIGIQDNVEIGAGKAVFLTLSAHGIEQLPVHILKSNADDFQPFLAS